MNWHDKAKEILDKIRKYREDSDGWKQAKKSVSFHLFAQPSASFIVSSIVIKPVHWQWHSLWVEQHAWHIDTD